MTARQQTGGAGAEQEREERFREERTVRFRSLHKYIRKEEHNQMGEITAKMPWAGSVGDMPLHLDYFEGSMFDKVAEIAKEYPNNVAFDFMGRSTTYKQLVREIEKCANRRA